MIEFLLIITFGWVLLVFLETFFLQLGFISFLIILSLLIYEKLSLWKYLLLFVPVSLVIDVYHHVFLGATFLAIIISTFIFISVKKYLPYYKLPVKVIFLFLTFIFYHIFIFFLLRIDSNFVFSDVFNLSVLLTSIRMAFFEVIFFLTFEFIIESIGGGSHNKFNIK